MTESNDQGDKTAHSAAPSAPRSGKTGTLTLNRTVDAGHVRQSFSHGRSKPVVVEKKKRRTITSPTGVVEEVEVAVAAPVVAKAATPAAAAPAAAAPTASPAAPVARLQPTAKRTSAPAGGAARTLSDDERDARLKALSIARAREADDRVKADEDAKRRALLDQQLKRDQEEAARAKAEEDRLRVQREQEAARHLAEGTTPKAAAPAAAPTARRTDAPARPGSRPTGRNDAVKGQVMSPADAPAPTDEIKRTAAPGVKRPERNEAEEDDTIRKTGPGGVKKAPPQRIPVKKVADDKRARGRLTIVNALDDQQRERSLSALKRRREREKAKQLGQLAPPEKMIREVIIPETITIQELSNRMAVRGVDIIKLLMKEGEMRKITDVIDTDTAELVVREFGHNPKRVSEADVEEGFIRSKADETDQTLRAPIVTIMGHVDHGKTSLLDAIRQTDVVAGEAGGITQHIGAYQVVTKDGHKITFIDTPGHEAFTAMRARGAKVTDIVVLVVAADDGVMPQTVEAIKHARAAGVPIIVAINKVDKHQADPDRVRTELLQHEIVVEKMSGETLDVEVSALKRTGLDKLMEAIILQSEVLELKANPDVSAEGIVIEAKLEAGRGPVGTVLIQRGTLHVGDIMVAGSAFGRVRALINDHGQHVQSAGPSVPVEVLGFNSAPEAGDQLAVVESDARARELTEYRIRKRRERLASGGSTGGRTLEQMMSSLKGEGRKEFKLLIKGDVQGSVEAINAALEKLGTEEVAARIVHWGVGGITESDISLANASEAIIIGFNVRANVQAKAHAERDGIEIRYYSIIYDLIDDVKKAMSGLLAPTFKENFLGNALILDVFNISKVGKVAGCRITEGKVERGAKVRLIRDNVVVHEGSLSTLKRFKDEVKDVPAGQECGMAFEKYEDMRKGDVIECFNVETIIRSL
jgi:translation initiation factor IF-2